MYFYSCSHNLIYTHFFLYLFSKVKQIHNISSLNISYVGNKDIFLHKHKISIIANLLISSDNDTLMD